MERDPVHLPARLARLVQKANAEDLTRELTALLAEGRRHVSVGLGPGVDVPLLDEELYAAEVALLDRELVVMLVRVEADGYVIERGWSNFGVYTWAHADPGWNSVPSMGMIRGLRDGDKVALGSAPADSLTFVLPPNALIPRAIHSSPDRSRTPPRPRLGRADTPPSLEDSLTYSSASSSPRRRRRSNVGPTPFPARRRPPAERSSFQPIFDHALKYWHYSMITFGSDPDSVIVVADPELAGLRAALGRNLAKPGRGYDLFVKNPGPDLWVKMSGEAVRMLRPGDTIHLNGPGNRIGFHGYVVELLAPIMPQPRFKAGYEPTDEEIGETLEVPVDRLADQTLVTARYLTAIRGLHPDHHEGNPGHLSRYLELKTCFDTWKTRFAG